MLMLMSSQMPRSSSSSLLRSSPSFWMAQVFGAILMCPPDLIEQRIPMMAPFPQTYQEIQKRMEVDKLLGECWKNPDAGYEIQPTDEWIVNNQEQQPQKDRFEMFEPGETNETDARGKPSTYGEITSLGARQLFAAMGLLDGPRNSPQKPSPSIHFFDLGSGTGKLVGQVVLELPHESVHRATGIELSPSRHEAAVRAKEALLRSSRANNSFQLSAFESSFTQNESIKSCMSFESTVDWNHKLELIQGDLFDEDLSTATHIYVASLCFPYNLMVRLEERLQGLLQQQRQSKQTQSDATDNDCPKANSTLQWIASLKPFPNNLGGIRPIVRFMEMTWTKPLGSAVYLYRCCGARNK